MEKPEFTNIDETAAWMKAKLSKVVPEMELEIQASLVVEIEKLKKEKNAVILGHNYMEPALFHTVPDFVGDSLQLARVGAKTKAETIVFAGVEFMAETAKILSPEKTVLIPSTKAGCSLAQSITGIDVQKMKQEYPGVPVVSYVNTYADVKAETDICCTSSNAVQVVASLKTDRVIFIPDEYLAQNVARELGIQLIIPATDSKKAVELEKKGLQPYLIGWPGKCEVHDQFTLKDVENIRKQHPNAIILAHPECRSEVVEACDFSGSTSAMIKYVRDVEASQYVLLTECSMGDNITAEHPNKELLRLCATRCPHMAQITLKMVRDALVKNQFEVNIPEEVRRKAQRSLERMIEIG
jgi:quinolinate synthase